MGLFTGLFSKEKASEVVEAVNTLATGKGTTRLINDSNSDSWLSKNIRPMLALYSTFAITFILIFPESASADVKVLVFAVFSDIVRFYFVARTTEKVIKAIIKRY